jgi:hypothetical protein
VPYAASAERNNVSEIDPAFGLQPEAECAALHQIVRIVRDDMLVLGLDPGEELDDETPGPELVADQDRAAAVS